MRCGTDTHTCLWPIYFSLRPDSDGPDFDGPDSDGSPDRPYQSRAGVVDASFNLPKEDSSVCGISLGHGGEPRRQSQPATHDIPTEDSSGCAVSLGGDDRPRQAVADCDANASCRIPTEDSSGCAVCLGHDGDPRRQSQPATCDIPTEDSSGCAVSLGGDDSPYQSLAGVVDPSSACLKRTAQSVQLVLVVTTVHDGHYTVELMLLAASRQRTAQGV